MRPIPPAELAQSDAGPTAAMKTFMGTIPNYQAEWATRPPSGTHSGRSSTEAAWMAAHDPWASPRIPDQTECLPFKRRTLVGDSGQKTQGFLAKLGLTRSYVLVNAFAVALHPGKQAKGKQVLGATSRSRRGVTGFYDRLLAGGGLQAIVAFGDNAHAAYDLWAASILPWRRFPFTIAHPAAVDGNGSGNDAALKKWTGAVTKLRGLISADVGASASGPNYGDYLTENDYARIPRWDLPAAAPLYAGDDSWGRAATPPAQQLLCSAVPR